MHKGHTLINDHNSSASSVKHTKPWKQAIITIYSHLMPYTKRKYTHIFILKRLKNALLNNIILWEIMLLDRDYSFHCKPKANI